MQSGSSSQSGRNQGAAVEADAIGEQQLKQTQSGTAAKADAISEQQLKWTQMSEVTEAACYIIFMRNNQVTTSSVTKPVATLHLRTW